MMSFAYTYKAAEWTAFSCSSVDPFAEIAHVRVNGTQMDEWLSFHFVFPTKVDTHPQAFRQLRRGVRSLRQ